MLFYEDVKTMFPHTRGIQLKGVGFHAVSPLYDIRLEKGLYVPTVSHDHLFESINNGAIASLWDSKVEVPRFVPNHFPLFIVKDVLLAYDELIHFYKQKNNQEKWEIMTKFICNSESSLIKSIEAESLEDQNMKQKGGE
jgi:hypothetical protein